MARVQATFKIQIKTPLPKRPPLPQVPHCGLPQRPLATSLDCAASLRGRLPAPSHLPQFGKAEKYGRSRPRPPQGPVQSQPAAHTPRPPRASQAGISRRHSRACAVGYGRVRSTKWRRRGPRRGRSEPGEERAGRAEPPSRRAPRLPTEREPLAALGEAGSRRPGVQGQRRSTEGWRGEAPRFPLQTPSPPRPPFRLVAPSSTTKRESCPSAHLNQLRSLDAVLRTERSPGRSRPERP